MVVFGIAFAVFNHLSNNSEKIAVLEKEKELYKKEADKFRFEAKKVKENNAFLQDFIDRFTTEMEKKSEQVDSLSIEIVKVQAEYEKKYRDVINLKGKELAKYFQDRYQTNGVWPQNEQEITFITPVVQEVAGDLEKYDGTKLELDTTKEQVVTLQNIVETQDSISYYMTRQNSNLKLSIDKWNQAYDAQGNALKNSEKMFKSQKKNNFVWKAAAFVFAGSTIYFAAQ